MASQNSVASKSAIDEVTVERLEQATDSVGKLPLMVAIATDVF